MAEGIINLFSALSTDKTNLYDNKNMDNDIVPVVQSSTISMKLGTTDENNEKDNNLIEDDNADYIDYHEIMKEEYEHNDTRVAMIGNVDSGKSTLIGVLTNSLLDDGRGCARSLVLKHRHEQDNGRTSAVTVEIMGYNKDGEQVISHARNHNHRWIEIMEKSDKTVSASTICLLEWYKR